MTKPLSMIGKKFGKLTVIGRAGTDEYERSVWLCQCDCGNEIKAKVRRLQFGRDVDCGCVSGNKKVPPKRKLFTPEEYKERKRSRDNKYRKAPPDGYKTWDHMIQRCTNPKDKAYKHYGGRGIKVCERWRNSFEDFMLDMGPRPGPEYSIDRIDVNGHYEPGNCRWSTKEQQNNNKRCNKTIIYENQEMTIAQAAKKAGLPYKAFYYQYSREKSKINTNSQTLVCG